MDGSSASRFRLQSDIPARSGLPSQQNPSNGTWRHTQQRWDGDTSGASLTQSYPSRQVSSGGASFQSSLRPLSVAASELTLTETDDSVSTNYGPPVPPKEPHHVRRKPVNRMSANAPIATIEESVLSGTIRGKVEHLATSLNALSSSEYLNVEREDDGLQVLDHQTDHPPSYHASVTDLLRPETMSTTSEETTIPAIHRLVREGQLEALAKHLEDGGHPNETEPKTGRTPLMTAVRARRWPVCRLLITCGSQVHLQDIQGNTALHYCAREGDAEIAQMLVDVKASPMDFNKRGETPLLMAAQQGHNLVVRTLLILVPNEESNNPIVVNALFAAIKSGHVDTVHEFLVVKIKPKKIKETWKPAAYAAQSGSIPMLDFVLEHKWPLKETSPAGWTALHFAARHGNLSMTERLLSLKLPWKATTKRTKETALHLASRSNHTTIALLLLSHKDSSPTPRDSEGNEPLHHACRTGDLRLLTALLSAGAKWTTDENKHGWKPIHLAAAYGHKPLLTDALTREIPTLAEDKLSSPSFKHAPRRAHTAAQKGQSAEIRFPHAGARPLHLAIEFGHDDAALLLMSAGVKLEEGDAQGWRPIHYAAWNVRLRVVEELIRRKVNVEARTNDGNTASGLGQREYGMEGVSVGEREGVQAVLLAAVMDTVGGKKRGKLRSLGEVMGAAPGKKVAAQRDLVWHKALLTEDLYAGRQLVGGEGESLEMDYEDEEDEIGEDDATR